MKMGEPVSCTGPEIDTITDFPGGQVSEGSEFRCRLEIAPAGTVSWTLLNGTGDAVVDRGSASNFDGAAEALGKAVEQYSSQQSPGAMLI